MIGKSIKGKSFGGCVRYVVNKKEAAVLMTEGISNHDAAAMIRDFDLQRKLNPALGKAVGHTVLSWSTHDKQQLTDKKMIEIAQQYMQQMGITDKNDFARNAKVCRQLTDLYGMHIALGKERVNRQQLKGNDKVRYAVYDTLKLALKTTTNWQQLEELLKKEGIAIQYKYKSGSKKVQGVSFEKDGIVLKGSSIDRSMSFAGIEKQLRGNAEPLRSLATIKDNEWLSQSLKEEGKAFDTGIGLAESIGDILLGSLNPVTEPPAEELLWQQKKKRKKGKRM